MYHPRIMSEFNIDRELNTTIDPLGASPSSGDDTTSSDQAALQELKDAQLNVYNFRDMSNLPPSSFAAIRFDPNNTCNLHCVYCHNHRSTETIAEEDLRTYLYSRVISVDHFQVGCIMEPTLDSRLADLMLTISHSPAKPTQTFMLQTNGILLHRHDTAKLRDAGLSLLSVSVDAAEPDTQKELRNGTSLDKVIRNLDTFHNQLSEVAIDFITTVTTSNVGKMRKLVELGMNHGVSRFIFREVFYHPENDIVDHSRMPDLLLKAGQFDDMKQDLLATYGTEANFVFSDGIVLETSLKKMKADSLREHVVGSEVTNSSAPKSDSDRTTSGSTF
jgi:sulfatase maturation enzyme AslB (radical SAM superfamily)